VRNRSITGCHTRSPPGFCRWFFIPTESSVAAKVLVFSDAESGRPGLRFRFLLRLLYLDFTAWVSARFVWSVWSSGNGRHRLSSVLLLASPDSVAAWAECPVLTFICSQTGGAQHHFFVTAALWVLSVSSLIFHLFSSSCMNCCRSSSRHVSWVTGSKDSRICDLNCFSTMIFWTRPPDIRWNGYEDINWVFVPFWSSVSHGLLPVSICVSVAISSLVLRTNSWPIASRSWPSWKSGASGHLRDIGQVPQMNFDWLPFTPPLVIFSGSSKVHYKDRSPNDAKLAVVTFYFGVPSLLRVGLWRLAIWLSGRMLKSNHMPTLSNFWEGN
jgi:hypothetical protein